MAINNLTGLQGSGKSYEAVSTVILDGVMAGRRVVTNIDGIQPDLIHDYLVEKRKADPKKLGSVVHVTNEDVVKDDFFPDDEKPEMQSMVHRGDLVVIDEVWRFWSNDNQLGHNSMQFFRMHRHYVHPDTGVSCDLVIMIQDVSTLHRKLRSVVELTTRTVKLKAIGRPQNYRIELYEGWRISKQNHLDTYLKKYNPDIFPLYKSYAAGNGKETVIDKRQNILKNPRFIGTIVVAVLMVFGATWFVKRFFSGTAHGVKTEAPADKKTASTLATGAPPPGPSSTSQKPNFSSTWRFIGQYTAKGEIWYVLQSDTGMMRLASPSQFSGTGLVRMGTIDGEKVTIFTGALKPAAEQKGPLK